MASFSKKEGRVVLNLTPHFYATVEKQQKKGSTVILIRWGGAARLVGE